MQRDRRVGEVVELEIALRKPAQPTIGHEVVTPAAQAAD
jgi:hypothetical protein